MNNSIDYKKLDSAIITKLRFPLIFSIVLFHARFQNVNFVDANVSLETVKWYDYFTYCLESIGHIGVPLFYVISGYLFFYKNEPFNGNVYKHKIKKRIKSLFVPYVLWNVYSLALIVLASVVVPQYMSGRHNIINNFGVLELSKYFYAVDGNNPINGPLWFVRDLMVVSLCSPIIYYFIKRCCQPFLVLMGILWLFGVWDTSICGLYGFSSSAFLFFSIGASFSIKHKYLCKFTIWGGKIIPIYILLNVLDNLMRGVFPNHELMHKLCIFIGILAFIEFAVICVNKGSLKIFDNLSEYSFFLYCYHATVVLFLKKLLLKFVNFNSIMVANIELVFFYMIIVLLIVIIGYVLYYFLRRTFPKFNNIIMGSR